MEDVRTQRRLESTINRKEQVIASLTQQIRDLTDQCAQQTDALRVLEGTKAALVSAESKCASLTTQVETMSPLYAKCKAELQMLREKYANDIKRAEILQQKAERVSTIALTDKDSVTKELEIVKTSRDDALLHIETNKVLTRELSMLKRVMEVNTTQYKQDLHELESTNHESVEEITTLAKRNNTLEKFVTSVHSLCEDVLEK